MRLHDIPAGSWDGVIEITSWHGATKLTWRCCASRIGVTILRHENWRDWRCWAIKILRSWCHGFQSISVSFPQLRPNFNACFIFSGRPTLPPFQCSDLLYHLFSDRLYPLFSDLLTPLYGDRLCPLFSVTAALCRVRTCPSVKPQFFSIQSWYHIVIYKL